MSDSRRERRATWRCAAGGLRQAVETRVLSRHPSSLSGCEGRPEVYGGPATPTGTSGPGEVGSRGDAGHGDLAGHRRGDERLPALPEQGDLALRRAF